MEIVVESSKGKFDKFASNLNKIKLLFENNSNTNAKGEHLGFFITRFLNKVLDNFVDQSSVYFNSFQFNESDKKILIASVDSLAAMIDRSEPLKSCEFIQYILNKVVDNFILSCEDKSGIYCYLIGILDHSLSLINVSTSVSNSELTRKSRRFLIVKGIVNRLMVVLSTNLTGI